MACHGIAKIRMPWLFWTRATCLCGWRSGAHLELLYVAREFNAHIQEQEGDSDGRS